MARALHAWAINRRGINSVRNLRYGPQTRLVRGMYFPRVKEVESFSISLTESPVIHQHHSCNKRTENLAPGNQNKHCTFFLRERELST